MNVLAEVTVHNNAVLHNNWKDLDAFISQPMGKDYLANLLKDTDRKAHEAKYGLEPLRAAVDELEENRKSELLTMCKDVVAVRPGVLERAKKRRRRGAPASGPLVASASAPP